MKKILHLLASNKFSGAENVACTIIENFKENYEFAYCSPNGPIEQTLETKKIKYYELKKFNIINLKKVIDKFKPDIIHAHDYKASLLAAFSGFNGKIISHLHINALFAKSWNLKSLVYKLSINKYDYVVGVSNAVYNEAIFKNKLKGKYITIYNYVNKQKIIDLSNKYTYKKEYDLFFLGRLNELKNPIQFIEIVKKLKIQNNNLRAVIIGDGELNLKCNELIKNYQLLDNIDMLGFVENPYPIIKNCKIGIMPSKVEGFGLAAIEASILGKPVLNSGVGGLGEIFENNKELICTNIDEYCAKISDLNNLENNININLDSFCSLDYWKSNIEKIYSD